MLADKDLTATLGALPQQAQPLAQAWQRGQPATAYQKWAMEVVSGRMSPEEASTYARLGVHPEDIAGPAPTAQAPQGQAAPTAQTPPAAPAQGLTSAPTSSAPTQATPPAMPAAAPTSGGPDLLQQRAALLQGLLAQPTAGPGPAPTSPLAKRPPPQMPDFSKATQGDYEDVMGLAKTPGLMRQQETPAERLYREQMNIGAQATAAAKRLEKEMEAKAALQKQVAAHEEYIKKLEAESEERQTKAKVEGGLQGKRIEAKSRKDVADITQTGLNQRQKDKITWMGSLAASGDRTKVQALNDIVVNVAKREQMYQTAVNQSLDKKKNRDPEVTRRARLDLQAYQTSPEYLEGRAALQELAKLGIKPSASDTGGALGGSITAPAYPPNTFAPAAGGTDSEDTEE